MGWGVICHIDGAVGERRLLVGRPVGTTSMLQASTWIGRVGSCLTFATERHAIAHRMCVVPLIQSVLARRLLIGIERATVMLFDCEDRRDMCAVCLILMTTKNM